ncbi:hypothetical protein [Sulfurivermis fontis]|jgi:hypothetical protein|uniref:hypothetical protein n=1 Tax=Sulfurivermis fontis TaxID=1972068 RepID=UPI0018D4F2EF|nr:hypothetical protein [Sulfurivermis fontis]
MAKKRNSRILREMHETARDLHRIGLIDDKRMAEFDALCRPNGTDALRAAIVAGRSSGPGRPAEEVYDRLETKYRGLAGKKRK